MQGINSNFHSLHHMNFTTMIMSYITLIIQQITIQFTLLPLPIKSVKNLSISLSNYNLQQTHTTSLISHTILQPIPFKISSNLTCLITKITHSTIYPKSSLFKLTTITGMINYIYTQWKTQEHLEIQRKYSTIELQVRNIPNLTFHKISSISH